MILLGLILIVLAIGAGAVLVIAASALTQSIDLQAYGFTVGFHPLNLLLAGAGCMLLLWFGWAILVSSSRRRSRRRREAREADRLANEERLARERAAEERLAEQQRATEAARERAEMAERRASETGAQGYYETQPGGDPVQESSQPQDGSYPQPGYYPQQHERGYDPRQDRGFESGPARY